MHVREEVELLKERTLTDTWLSYKLCKERTVNMVKLHEKTLLDI